MPNRIGRRAVVIGAGMGGLAAAKAVAPFFEQVTVLDRDWLPDEPVPRVGTPQARHAHALLAGGEEALEALFPDLRGDLVKAGAVVARAGLDIIVEQPGYDPFPVRDLGFDTIFLSRPLLEYVCRRRLADEPNVPVQPRARVVAIVAAEGGAVAGVRCEDSNGHVTPLDADLVVDASGRAAPTLSFMEGAGWTKPEETEIGVDLGNATVIFGTPENAPEWKGVFHMNEPPKEFRRGSILPMEDRKWIVSIGGRHGDDPPGELEGFFAFAKTFRASTIHDAIRRAKPLTEVARHNPPASVRRHFERLPRTPRGLVPIGNSICRFNPVYRTT